MNRYLISTLNLESTLVLLTVGDQEVAGYVKFSRSGRPTYRVGTLARSVDVPRDAVFLWRPFDPLRWPDILPEPVRLQPEVNSWREQRVQHGPPDTPVRADGWPYPDVVLGRAGKIPKTCREAEARLLRMLRAFDVIYRDTPQHGHSAWPREWRVAASVIFKALRSSPTHKLAGLRHEDYADFYIDPTDVRALPARWQPTPRDVSDMEANGGAWIGGLSKMERSLFRWRSALPPYSFVQIAEHMDSTEDRARELYDRAVTRFYQRVGDHAHVA